MSTHRPGPNPVDGLQLIVKLYPWSVLWVLFAIGLVLILDGSIITTGLVFLLILAITYHSIRSLHHTTRQGDQQL